MSQRNADVILTIADRSRVVGRHVIAQSGANRRSEALLQIVRVLNKTCREVGNDFPTTTTSTPNKLLWLCVSRGGLARR